MFSNGPLLVPVLRTLRVPTCASTSQKRVATPSTGRGACIHGTAQQAENARGATVLSQTYFRASHLLSTRPCAPPLTLLPRPRHRCRCRRRRCQLVSRHAPPDRALRALSDYVPSRTLPPAAAPGRAQARLRLLLRPCLAPPHVPADRRACRRSAGPGTPPPRTSPLTPLSLSRPLAPPFRTHAAHSSRTPLSPPSHSPHTPLSHLAHTPHTHPTHLAHTPHTPLTPL